MWCLRIRVIHTYFKVRLFLINAKVSLGKKALCDSKSCAVVSTLRCSLSLSPLRKSQCLWLGQPEKNSALVGLTDHFPSFSQGVWASESARSGDRFGLDSLRWGNHVRGGESDGWRRPVNSDRPAGGRHEGVCPPGYQLAPQQRQEIPSDQWWATHPGELGGGGAAAGKGEPWDRDPGGIPQFRDRSSYPLKHRPLLLNSRGNSSSQLRTVWLEPELETDSKGLFCFSCYLE